MKELYRSDDPAYVKRQYQSKDPLSTRIRTHIRYTQPQVEFVDWVLNKTHWTGLETVIDIGCGPGNYSSAVRERAKLYIAGDLSAGMLAEIASEIPRIQLDAGQLPLADLSADVIMTNHMLYHLPALEYTLNQIKRVLRNGGRLIATTNSKDSMAKLKDLMIQIGREISHKNDDNEIQDNLVNRFNLENGREVLSPYFLRIERYILWSSLVFPAAEPVIDYVNSMKEFYTSLIPADIDWSALVTRLGNRVRLEIHHNGQFEVSKKTGVFICYL